MKTLKITFAAIALLLLLSVAGMAYLATYLERHRGLLELGASEALGREVRIEDGVSLHWSMTPSIALAGLWIGNPDWASGEYLVHAEGAVLEFDVRELFQRRLAVKQVTVQHAEVFLETARDGKQNWIFGGETSADVGLQIDKFEFENSRLHYHAPDKTDQQLDIEQLELLGLGGESLRLVTAFSYQDVAISVSAAFSQATPPLQISNLEVEVQGDQLDLSRILGAGAPTLPLAGSLQQIKARLNTSGDTLDSLLSNLSGELEIGSAQLSLTAGKAGTATDTTLHDTRLSIAPGKPAQLRTGLLYEKQPFQVELTGGTLVELFSGNKVWKTIQVKAQGQFDSKPLQITGQLGPSTAVLSGRDLDIDLVVRHDGLESRLDGRLARSAGLEGSHFNIQVSAPSLSRLTPWVGKALPETEPLVFSAQFEGGEQLLNFKELEASVGAIDLTGELHLLLRQGERMEIAASPFVLSKLELEIQGDQLDLSRIFGAGSSSLPIAGPLRQIKARLNTSGDTLESLLSNLSGVLEIGSTQLSPPAGKAGAGTAITLHDTRLSITPGKPAQLRTGLLYEKQPFQVELTGGTLVELFSGNKVWKTIQVKAEGQFDSKPLQITGQLGPSTAVLSGRDLDIDLVVRHNGLESRLDGRLARSAGLEGSRFNIQLSAPSLSRLTPWVGKALPETEPLVFSAQFEGSEQLLTFKKLEAKIAAIDLTGELHLPLVQGERIEITLKSNSLDLTPYLAKGPEETNNSETILNWELAPESLPDFDALLRVEVKRFQAGELSFDDVRLDATLHSGHLKLVMATGVESLNAKVDLKPEGSAWRLTLRNASKLDLGQLIDQGKDLDVSSQAPVALDMDLNGSGRSLAAVLASAQGQLGVVVGAGRLSEAVSEYLPLGSVLDSLLDTIAKGGKAKAESQLECAVLQLEVSDGIATSTKGLALRTDRVNVMGGGAFNLSTGEIELQFKTAQRKGLGISILGLAENFIRLTGTLRQPEVDVNLDSFVVHGGAAWATGGLSLLYDSLATRLTAFSNPCETVLKSVKKYNH